MKRHDRRSAARGEARKNDRQNRTRSDRRDAERVVWLDDDEVEIEYDPGRRKSARKAAPPSRYLDRKGAEFAFAKHPYTAILSERITPRGQKRKPPRILGPAKKRSGERTGGPPQFVDITVSTAQVIIQAPAEPPQHSTPKASPLTASASASESASAPAAASEPRSHPSSSVPPPSNGTSSAPAQRFKGAYRRDESDTSFSMDERRYRRDASSSEMEGSSDNEEEDPEIDALFDTDLATDDETIKPDGDTEEEPKHKVMNDARLRTLRDGYRERRARADRVRSKKQRELDEIFR